MSKAAELANLIGNINAGGGGVNRNLIINGAFNVAQRGTSHTTTSAYTLDRWTFQTDLLDQYAHTVTQSTDTPEGFSSSLKIEVTTSETSVETSEDLALTQRIEAQNLQHLQAGTSSAKSLALSFYVKSSVTGVYAVHLQAIDDSKIFPTTYTINSANTWEYKTIAIPPCTIATIDNDNGTGFNLTFITISGSQYTGGSTGSWQSYASNLFAAGHQANVSSDGDTWLITGVQLEVGQNPTSFEHEPFSKTLEKCKRYYSEQFPPCGAGVTNGTTGVARVNIPLEVEMRTAPTISISGTIYVYSGTHASTINSLSQTWATPNKIEIDATSAGTMQSGSGQGLAVYNETASSGTINVAKSESGGGLKFDAEL